MYVCISVYIFLVEWPLRQNALRQCGKHVITTVKNSCGRHVVEHVVAARTLCRSITLRLPKRLKPVRLFATNDADVTNAQRDAELRLVDTFLNCVADHLRVAREKLPDRRGVAVDANARETRTLEIRRGRELKPENGARPNLKSGHGEAQPNAKVSDSEAGTETPSELVAPDAFR